MRSGFKWVGVVAFFAAVAGPVFATTTEVLKNDKVAVTEVTLAPGAKEPVAGHHASVVVYKAGEKAEIRLDGGGVEHESIVRGEAVKEPAKAGILINMGAVPLKLVRVEFLTAGGNAMWGRAGLAPSYQMIFEDQYSRVYNIRVAPHASEPQHTHRDRVVVCLGGAQIEHVLPNGSIQNVVVKTDDVLWRQEQTHKAHNIGETELWEVVIEPK
jgi:predicted metal-dependent enzyme (double-stranded beta helix superfamily)